MPRLVVESTDRIARNQEPVTCGIPWPRGLLRDANSLVLLNAEGGQIPLQARTLDRWSDGSARWVLLDWQAEIVDGNDEAHYRVEHVTEGMRPAAKSKLQVTEVEGGVEVETGAACFRIGTGFEFPFRSIMTNVGPAIDPSQTRFLVQSEDGQTYEPSIRDVTVVEGGPLRVAVRIEGELVRNDGAPLGRLQAFLHFFAGSPVVRFDLSIHNPKPASHPKNHWDLGRRGSIFLADASLTVSLPAGEGEPAISGSENRDEPLRVLDGPVEIYQDSSGGDHWRSPVHMNRRRTVPNTFRGYRFRTGRTEKAGKRATPILEVSREQLTIAATMEYFWQDFPKSMEINDGKLILRLFPGQYADVHEIQGGERKTHTFAVAFGPDPVAEVPLAWCRSPLHARAEPSWYASAEAVPHLTPLTGETSPDYIRMVEAAIKGRDTFEHKREVIDEYGWRHFGEVYADHEAVFHRGSEPRASHYNNQYDVVLGCAIQFFRSGDARWWRLMHELARHVADIDIYHTDGDKSAYNHGLFWHTYHYVNADTGTHRAYPGSVGISGGGPSGGHNYSTGLMYHSFLTGDLLSREAALELAGWTIDMDDGRKTVYRRLTTSPTGHATSSGTADYHGPGRAPANCVTTLVNAHRLTGDERYLHKAEEFIRRCIHPADNVEARDLLDAENKWFYTMFLQALGNYLDHKAERGQLDQMYAYTRESLLHYARWMVRNEYLYLERPDKLEYPTETWAAQDLRKCETFYYAAKYSSGPERDVLLQRAEYFFLGATSTLRDMPTRSLARPVALLLVNGYSRAFFLGSRIDAAPNPDGGPFDFGCPTRFVPQKTVAIRRFKILAVASIVVTSIIAIGSVAKLVLSAR